MTLTSDRPLLNVQTRSGPRLALTPAPSLTPINVEASSTVRRVHGSMAPGVADGPASLGLAAAVSTGAAVGPRVGATLPAAMFAGGVAEGALPVELHPPRTSARMRREERADFDFIGFP